MRFWKFIKDALKNNPEEIPLNIPQEQSSSESQEDSSKEQNEEQSQESGQSSSESQRDSSEEQNEEQFQESGQSSSESQEDSSKEQNEEQSQESGQSSSESQEDSSEEQNEEQSQESEQSSSESQRDSSKEQSKEQSQENENQSGDLQDDNYEGQIEKLAEEIENNSKLTSEEKLQLLEKLKKSIEEIKKRKALKLQRKYLHPEKQEVTESQEEEYPLSAQQNNFLNQLQELPSFKDRERGPGYSIDTESTTEIPESLMRTLITKFLNQRFCLRNTDLNVRSNSLEKSDGFYKWNVKDVIVDFKTHQLNKVLHDKYGYDYADGKNENVPLSFYFDMSGSMSRYTNMLAVIAIELLKKDVKVLIGYNERVNVQIESIEKNITVAELAKILESAGYYDNRGFSNKTSKIRYKCIEKNVDHYLISKKAEKCVVFSDFDPKKEIISLSQAADVYWFCFDSSCDSADFGKFNGFVYKVQGLEDIAHGLVKVNEKRFETLCYVDNPKSLQKEHAK